VLEAEVGGMQRPQNNIWLIRLYETVQCSIIFFLWLLRFIWRSVQRLFFWTNRITHYKQQSSHYFAVEYVRSTDIQQRELRTVIHKLDCLIAVTYYKKYLPLNVGYFRFK